MNNKSQIDLEQSLINHMESIRQAYLRRDIHGYLAGFADWYCSFRLGDASWLEDKSALREKMLSEFERYEILSMNFEVVQVYVVGERGYAYLSYASKLKPKENSSAILNDIRSNLIIAKYLGESRWLIEAKIVISANNYFE